MTTLHYEGIPITITYYLYLKSWNNRMWYANSNVMNIYRLFLRASIHRWYAIHGNYHYCIRTDTEMHERDLNHLVPLLTSSWWFWIGFPHVGLAFLHWMQVAVIPAWMGKRIYVVWKTSSHFCQCPFIVRSPHMLKESTQIGRESLRREGSVFSSNWSTFVAHEGKGHGILLMGNTYK